MPTISLPVERFLFGNENWRSNRAVDEINVYCDLLDGLQARIDSLQTRGRSEEATLVNVQAVLSSYAVEIAMKSLWALDNSPATPPRGRDGHDLLKTFDGLKSDTIDSLRRLQLTRDSLKGFPTPFLSNRYSMECGARDIAVYDTTFLRKLAQLLEDKIDQARRELVSPAQEQRTCQGSAAQS